MSVYDNPRMVLLLLGLAVVGDGFTTMVGVAAGIPEAGLLATLLLPHLGPLYYSLEYLVVSLCYLVSARVDRSTGVIVARLVHTVLILAVVNNILNLVSLLVVAR